MNNGVSTMQVTNGSLQCGTWGLVSLVLSGALLVHVGYDLGMSHAKKLLKQHDKDIRIMYKREQMIRKEFMKREKRNEGSRWSWFKKKT